MSRRNGKRRSDGRRNPAVRMLPGANLTLTRWDLPALPSRPEDEQ